MLKNEDDVLEIIRQVVEDIGNGNARVLFSGSFNIIGKIDSQNPTKRKIQPIWEIDLEYPMGIGEKTKTHNFKIDTSKFQNENEIKKFIRNKISDK